METIRYLLGVIVKLAVAFFFVALVLWMVGLLYPAFSIRNLLSTDVFDREWLPAPRNISLVNGANNDRNVFVPGTSYNDYAAQPGVEFVAYTSEGKKVIRSSNAPTASVSNGNTGIYANRSLYVRNLSIYENGSIFYGQEISGEARDTLFRNGTFNVLIVDSNGRLIAVAPAINTGTWSIPGWNRFRMTIPTRLPANTSCSLVFQSANQPLQVSLPVRCN